MKIKNLKIYIYISLCLFRFWFLRYNPETRRHQFRSGSDSSSRTKGAKQPRHGKWCNSIHLQVNPSGEPKPVPPRTRQLEARGPPPGADSRRRGRPGALACSSAAASAAWRPQPGAAARLTPRGLRVPPPRLPLRALPLATSFKSCPATPSASLSGLRRLLQPAKQLAFPPSFPLFSPLSERFFRAFLQTSRGQIIIAAQRICRHSCSVKLRLTF